MAPNLGRGLVAGLLVVSAPAEAGTARWNREIAEAARRFSIPAEWIARVMQAESDGRTRVEGKPITSTAGAMGLMQLMPATWDEIRLRYQLGGDPHDPRDNIMAGAAYLKQMYDRFGYPGLFAAYHAGPRAYARHLERGSPLPPETRRYLSRVLGRDEVTEVGAKARRNRKNGAIPRASSPIFVKLMGQR
ncbi:MAG: lytic transglycosylase domain-containing protein [Sphingomonas sp.]|nr:lytic transglycosylase domain-containing protein [Sphingomonas sp.]